MASVDLARRAEIGKAKRARTRERLISAASAALGRLDRESVSVDEIVAAAGVAKGTFYVHFEDVEALWAELAERLTRDFDELLQPRRMALKGALDRVAYGCAAFLEKGRRDPAWATMVARAARKRPGFGAVARARLSEDLGSALAALSASGLQPEIASEMVSGIVLRVGSLLPGQAPELVEASVAAILRAVGVNSASAAALAAEAAKRARIDIDVRETEIAKSTE
jgi:AcrR family transcriptional regulator